MITKYVNKLLGKCFDLKVDRSIFFDKPAPDHMIEVTDIVDNNLLKWFNKDIKIFTDVSQYVFVINNKVVYWGNIDNNFVVATINLDMKIYPNHIKNIINQSLDPKYQPDTISVIRELLTNSEKGNVQIKEKTNDGFVIGFNPTKE